VGATREPCPCQRHAEQKYTFNLSFVGKGKIPVSKIVLSLASFFAVVGGVLSLLVGSSLPPPPGLLASCTSWDLLFLFPSPAPTLPPQSSFFPPHNGQRNPKHCLPTKGGKGKWGKYTTQPTHQGASQSSHLRFMPGGGGVSLKRTPLTCPSACVPSDQYPPGGPAPIFLVCCLCTPFTACVATRASDPRIIVPYFGHGATTT
jgi:hypothetical protein